MSLSKFFERLGGFFTPSFIIMAAAVITIVWLLYTMFFSSHHEAENKKAEEVMEVTVRHSVASQRTIMARFNGSTKAYKSINLRPEIDGVVKKIYFQDGSFVRAGEVIIEFEQRGLGDSYRESQKDLKAAQLKLKSAKILYDKQLSSKEAYLQAQAQLDKAQARLEDAQANLDKVKVKAPFDGYLERLLVKEGDYVSGMLQSVFATFNMMDKLLVSINATLENIKMLEQASDVFVTNNYYSTKAVVNFIGKMADPITKTFPIDLIIDNNGYNFRVGENIRVEALYTYDRPLHYIPKSCLVLSDDGEIAVRVIDENSIARRMRIIVRDEDEEGFWISGLHDEEDIITIGVAYVPDNQKVLAVRDDK